VPDTLFAATAVAAGEHFSLAIDAKMQVIGWGLDNFGQISPPYPNDRNAFVTAGVRHGAAVLTDGSVVCWGWNDYNQCEVPKSLPRAVKVGAGYGFTVALTALGSVVAWGSSDFGVVGQVIDVGIARDIDVGPFAAAALLAPCGSAGPAVCTCGPLQFDGDLDGVADCAARGYGDLDLDGVIGASDLSQLLDQWGVPDAPLGDIDLDGAVGASDLSLLLARWGEEVG
jgi:hypothetical protein